MARILKEQDIREMLIGGAFLGAGGGGGLVDGIAMLEDNVKRRGSFEITLITPEEMDDSGYAVMIAGMGAPSALHAKKEKFLTETQTAYEAMKDIAFLSGKRLDAIIPIEFGPVTSFIPMITCAEKNVPLLDVDACGRAVPGLDCCMFNINKLPFSPGVATSDDGDVIYVLPADPMDYKEAENMCRYLCGAYDFVIGLGSNITSKEEVMTKLIPGGITLQQNVGKAILEAKANKADVKAALEKVLPLRVLATGVVEKNEQISKQGHDIGITTLKGDDGVTYYADVKNETIVFRTAEKALVTCPDLICCIDLDTYTPLTNAAIEAGMRVMYCATPAHEMWFANPEGTACWKPYFEAVGYEGGVIRY